MNRSRRRSGRISVSVVVAFLAGMLVATLFLTMFHGAMLHHSTTTTTTTMTMTMSAQDLIATPWKNPQSSQADSSPHQVAGLDCSAHGGPDASSHTPVIQDLVYWKDFPHDNAYISPLKSKTERQYLTFEPDGGGWNNIRMSMETVLAMAEATGRVLVLPPSQRMYLLDSTSVSFADFFPLHDMAKEHAGLEILTMKEFLEETKGKLRDKTTNQIALPPDNGRTDWDGDTAGVMTLLNPWFQTIAPNPDWNPDHCIAAFPKSTDPDDVAELQRIFEDITQTNSPPQVEDFIQRPTPVNGTTRERMLEFLADRKQLCLYGPELQQAQIIHFNGKRNQAGRLLVHFYAFLFFQDYHTDLWMKRFVRDHVRYIDNVQCAAARVIAAVRQHSQDKGNQGLYDAFHIRRGDFQYKKTRVSAEEILQVAQDQIPKGATVYVGTDERQKEFFKPMTDYWDVLFLDDFMGLLDGIDKNHYGMIDQLVTSRGRVFFGCWFSTFTSYIMRLRGHHSQLEGKHEEGYELGLLPNTYYYALAEHKTKMHEYWPIKRLFYAREFPAAWRNIDLDVS